MDVAKILVKAWLEMLFQQNLMDTVETTTPLIQMVVLHYIHGGMMKVKKRFGIPLLMFLLKL